jgi:serine/threonine protein kinase
VEPVRHGPLKVGDTFLDKYEVRRLIGSGGHAFVYQCFDLFLSRVVAIKVIKPAGEGVGNIHERARTEAQLLVRIDHERLVKVIDAGIWQGLVYLVMEYLEGRNLREVLRELGRLSVAETLTIGYQIAEGMAYAHGKRVIHRDLKPENIFILAENAAKVLDFGIAKVRGLDGLDAKTTQKDMVQGTWLYMSPEHLQGHQVTPQSDIFALGTLLYESLYTHPLRVGEAPVGREEAAWMQMFKVPPLLSDLDTSIPRYVAKAVQRAVLKVPGERYADMREFMNALLGALKRHLDEDGPKGLVVTRQLYKAQAMEVAKPAGRETLRAVPVLTNQVTVKAPAVLSGQTEPLPPIVPVAPKSASPQPGKVVSGTPPKPIAGAPLMDQPTIWVKPNTSPEKPSSPQQAKSHSLPPAKNAAPGTPPPIASPTLRNLPQPPLVLWSKDRAIRLAALAGVLCGIIGGIAYAVVTSRARAAQASQVVTTALPNTAAATRAEPEVTLPPPVAPVENAPVAQLPAAHLEEAPATQPATPAAPAIATPPAQSARTPPAPRKVHIATRGESVGSGLPSVDEVHRTFEELDRKTKAKPAASPAPAPTTTSRQRETVF